MRCVVQKYGGSSVADLDRLREVAARIADTHRTHPVVAVVSAMGNTTNELIHLAQQVSPRPDRRELDMLISTGERISMALLAMALRERGVPARSLTGSQSGIITDERHADARVVEVRPERIRQHLAAGEVVIVAGFQGVSRAREVTTLGRGGSDTTAVVLAAALDAAWCEICSDVDGVWSADPRQVPTAVRLDALGLDAALSLARGGAKVLFEDAVRYARDAGVELRAVATRGPGAGTRLTTTRTRPGEVLAVAHDDQLRRVEVRAADLLDVARALQGQGCRLRQRAGGVLLLDVRNAHGDLVLPAGATDAGPTATVTAVGSGVGERLDLLGRGEETLGALARGCCGASGDALWWEMPPGDAAVAVRALHDALVVPAPGA